MKEALERMQSDLNKSLALIEQNKDNFPKEALDLFRKEQAKGTFDIDKITKEYDIAIEKLNQLKL